MEILYDLTLPRYKKIFDSLNPEFSQTCQELLTNLSKEYTYFIPYFGLRDLKTQAKLWRQSRSIIEINNMISLLKNKKADYLAQTIESVGPQIGKWATNAIPGLSNHNYGFALDVVYSDNGQYIWDGDHHGYKILQQHIENYYKNRLKSGFNFSHKDAGHIEIAVLPANFPNLHISNIKSINDYLESLKV